MDVGQFLVVYQEGGIHIVGQRVWSSYPTPVIAYDTFDIAASSAEETRPEVAFNKSCNCYLVTYDSEKNFLYKIFTQQVYGTFNDEGQLDGNQLKVAESQWG